jgi:hypothetical protein
MLLRKAPLEDDDLIDIVEREAEGVQVDWGQATEEQALDSVFGGLLTARRVVHVRELKRP